MGSLSLNKKYITNIRASTSGVDHHIFLGGSNNTISTFLNSAELTGNNSSALADRILIYDINANAYLTYFLRGDGVTWRRAGSTATENNTIIPNNSIISLNSASAKTFTMQGTNLIQKYYQGNISIKKQNLGGGKLRTYKNLILNSKFDADNTFPYAGFDANYYINGWEGGGSQILTNYYHNSPLFFEEFGYVTFANRTFHNINSPYNPLTFSDPLQPRLMKLYGAGSKFGRSDNNTNYLKTITSTTSLAPTDSQSWVKYGVEQIVPIPSAARKITYGVKYLVKGDDTFRENNFGGLVLYFQYGSARSYVNTHIIKSSNSSTPISTLESLYTENTYVNFDADYGSNAMCQWLGPNTSKVKVKRRSSILSSTDSIVTLYDTIDIPTFSAAGAQPDAVAAFPEYVSLQMFFAEWVAYLNNSGILSGSIYFYEPFLYFTEF